MDNPINSQEIQVQIICQNLPGSQVQERTSVRLGIQKGTCVIDDVSAGAASATFWLPSEWCGTLKPAR